MEQYIIKGGHPLVGEVEIGGAKNAALAILAAGIMTDETVHIENLPDVNDINVLLDAIQGIGASVHRVNRHTVTINGRGVSDFNIEYDYIKKIRASYYLLGALLGKYKRAEVALPGGCNIGSRPIDQHLKGFRALGGLGSGCAFSMLTAVPLQWFPEKRGLVSGITVGVVGVSGIIMNPFCDFLLAGHGYRFAMLTITAIYGVLCLGGFFVEDRPDDMRSEGEDPVSVGTGMKSCVKQYRTGEMLRTRTYYTISLTMALAVPAYVLVNPLMKSLGMERGLTGAEALLGVTLASVANIIGRFAMPWLSDRVGRKAVIRGMYLAAAVAVVGLVAARGGIFILLISVVCLVYGGVVSVFPVVVSDHFGLKYQGINYGAVMIGYGIASILCPYLLDGLGLEASFVAAGVACVIGLVGTRFF